MTNKTSKAQKWKKLEERFSKTVDRLGMPIDPGIFETVVALNAFGLPTTASCEGHLNWGEKAPWVDIGEQPSEDDLNPIRGKSMAVADVFKKYPKLKQNRDKNLKLQRKILKLLTEFYRNHNPTEDVRLTLLHFGIYGVIRFTNHGVNIQEINSKKEQKEKLVFFQKEMKDFGEFLKRKYYNSL